MDHFSAALLTLHRDPSADLAFSALPHAPRQQPPAPSPLRRSLGRGLVRTARWLAPEVVTPARSHPAHR